MDRLPTVNTMQQKRKKELGPVTSCALASTHRRLSFEDVCCGSHILRKVMEYLDAGSLKSCRQVNKEWEAMARELLMETHELDVSAWRSTSPVRLGLFSSWKVDFDNIQRIEPFWTSVLQDWGQGVKCLHILGVTPGWTTIIRGILTSWCSNLLEIRLCSAPDISCPMEFFDVQEFCHHLDRTETVEDFQTALENTQLPIFQSLPTIASIHTVTMEWNSDSHRMPACLPVFIFIIVKSCPGLKHLNLMDLEPSLIGNCLEDSRFGILMHLARHPAITKKPASFVWRMKLNHNPDLAYRREVETQPIRFVTGNPKIPRMQFGACLKSMHWDIMHIDRNGGPLLPGILNQIVAGNLKRLSSNRVVMDANKVMQLQRTAFSMDAYARRRWTNLNISPVQVLTLSYPSLLHLRELAISIETCKSIRRFHELIDAVPGIQQLEIVESFASHLPEDDRFLTDMMAPVDSVIGQHTNLRILSFNVRLRSAAVVEKIVLKFPHLQELSIGYAGVFQGHFDLSQRALIDFLMGLRCLKRFQLKIPDNLDMVHLIQHIVAAQESLPWIEKYTLQFIPCYIITGHAEYLQRR
jgi:hypothetical protein